ncbi:MAG: type II toxin-antitoxin system RelE/ParE family toxin [bacterium]|nr:type II toxin-antitoxin system RelE/ParE family toxin [bacterium]
MVKPPYSGISKEVLKPLVWVGPSKEVLTNFPASVRRHLGFALYQAQAGLKHRDSKPLKGLGSSVLEVVSRHDGDTYRAVYTVRWKAAVYVLHAFQKKAKRGTVTPKPEIELIQRRLRAAEQHCADTYGKG